MNNVDSYRKSIDESLEKIINNSNYFASFGDVYITTKAKEYLDNISNELEKTKALLDEIDTKE